MFFIFLIIFLQKKLFSNERINLKISITKKINLITSDKLKSAFIISFCSLPVILGFFIPFLFLIFNSMMSIEVLFLKDTIINSFNTILLATISSFIIIVLSLLINYSARIKGTRLNLFFNKLASLGYAIPGSIIAIGILIPFTYFDNFFINFFNENFNLNINAFFTGSIFVLCFAYIVRFFTISQTNI